MIHYTRLWRAPSCGGPPLCFLPANAMTETTSQLPIDRDPNGVVTLTLRQEGRPVVVLDWALLKAIGAAMERVAAMQPRGFVLASDSRVFVAGANLEEIVALSDPQLQEYLSFGQLVFGQISALACPTVAAINGAVLGGGLEIAMHCDRLIGVQPFSPKPDKPATPFPIGLPEAGLSICPGWGGTNMLPARMDPKSAITMTATGRTFTSVDAHKAGLLEELVETPDRLLARARELAASGVPRRKRIPEPVSISTIGRAEEVRAALAEARRSVPGSLAAEAVFECVEAGLAGGWRAALDMERQHLVRLRNTPQGREAIKAFFERSSKKG